MLEVRSRKGEEENEVIGSPVQDKKQSKAYNKQLPSYIAYQSPLDTRSSLKPIAVANLQL
jgi:hypothetical protein